MALDENVKYYTHIDMQIVVVIAMVLVVVVIMILSFTGWILGDGATCLIK